MCLDSHSQSFATSLGLSESRSRAEERVTCRCTGEASPCLLWPGTTRGRRCRSRGTPLPCNSGTLRRAYLFPGRPVPGRSSASYSVPLEITLSDRVPDERPRASTTAMGKRRFCVREATATVTDPAGKRTWDQPPRYCAPPAARTHPAHDHPTRADAKSSRQTCSSMVTSRPSRSWRSSPLPSPDWPRSAAGRADMARSSIMAWETRIWSMSS